MTYRAVGALVRPLLPRLTNGPVAAAAGLLAAFVVAGAPRPAVAQATWVTQVKAEIVDSRLVRGWLGQGFRLSHDPIFAVTDAGDSHDVWLTLRADWQYRIIGKCDYDCTDIDVELFDAAGRRVAADLRADDFPAVEITPPADGRYRLRVTMAACSTRNCGWGVVAVRR